MSAYRDETIACKDCGQDFLWTGREQDFYIRKGLSQPKRCEPCRAKNREKREARERRGSADKNYYVDGV